MNQEDEDRKEVLRSMWRTFKLKYHGSHLHTFSKKRVEKKFRDYLEAFISHMETLTPNQIIIYDKTAKVCHKDAYKYLKEHLAFEKLQL